MKHKIIEEVWSDKIFRDYITRCKKKSNGYRLSFNENLFVILMSSHIDQESARGDKYLNRVERVTSAIKSFLKDIDCRFQTLKETLGFLSIYASVYGILAGTFFWKGLRKKNRRRLSANMSVFLFVTQNLPAQYIHNYNRWRDYCVMRKEMFSLLKLLPKLAQYIINAPFCNDCDTSLDYINCIYSAYYYIHDDNKDSRFSDFIFNIVRSDKSILRDRLYLDLYNSSLRYEIHTEYQNYCKRKNVNEKSIFDVEFTQPQSDPINEESTKDEPIARDDYFPNLKLNDTGIRKLYEKLEKDKYILKGTDYAIFHFRLSGRDRPSMLKPIVWLKGKNELSYFSYRLTRTDCGRKDCHELATDRNFFEKTKLFFEVQGKEWKKADNLSDMSEKMSNKKKTIICKLFNENLE